MYKSIVNGLAAHFSATTFRMKLLTTILSFLEFLGVVINIGLIFWMYFLPPTTRIMISLSYIIVLPLILWILTKILRKTTYIKLSLISSIISSTVLYIAIQFYRFLLPFEIGNALLNYLSTLLFAIMLYYVFAGEHGNSNQNRIDTVRDSIAYFYRFIAKDYYLYFIRTAILVFYAFTLIFGHLRDIGIHNSILFEYEQYSIVLIIAIDRIINAFKKDFARSQEFMKIRKDNQKEQVAQAFASSMGKQFKEIEKQFKLLFEMHPYYDIENMNLWEYSSDNNHPMTKILSFRLVLSALTNYSSDEIEDLLISIGKRAKEEMERPNEVVN